MYWAEYSGGSAILGGCLDKENFTLEELLDHDDILQECKLLNKKLVEFLEETSTIEKLINLIIKEPTNTTDPANSYRYPALACEIFTCGLPKILFNLANNKDLLKLLYSFLDSKPPLNPLLASFFAKTLQALLTRHCSQDWFTYQYTCLNVISFSKCSSTFLSKLLEHIGTSAIMDTILYTMQIEEKQIKQEFLNWLDSQKFIEKLISIMCGNFDNIHTLYENPGFSEDSLNKLDTACSDEKNVSPAEEADPSVDLINAEKSSLVEVPQVKEPMDKRLIIDISENAATLLCEIVSKQTEMNVEYPSDVLRQKCLMDFTIDYMLTSMFNSSLENREYAIVNGIQVLMTILSEGKNQMKESSNGQSNEVQPNSFTVDAILPYFPQLKDVLLQSPSKFQYGYSNGIEVPVGALRLSVIKLFETLICMDSPAIASAFVENNILPILLDMFIQYKWNNFLHSSVTTIINKMFENTQHKDMYSNHLFEDCALLEKIIKAWEENDEAEKSKKPRHGYMGYLIKIANNVRDYFTTYSSIYDKISAESKEKWEKLFTEGVEPINKVQNVCLGGPHPLLANNNNSSIQQDCDDRDNKYQVRVSSMDDNREFMFIPSSKEAFESLCERKNSMEGDESTSQCWDNSLLKDESCDFLEERNSQTFLKAMDETALYGLASKLSGYDVGNYNFEEWLSQNASVWDDSGSMNRFMSTEGQPSIIVGNLSPWDTNSNIPNDNIEWADFSNCENRVNMGEFQDQFSCDPFQLGKSEGESSDSGNQHSSSSIVNNPFGGDLADDFSKIASSSKDFNGDLLQDSDILSMENNDNTLSKMIENISLDVQSSGLTPAPILTEESDKKVENIEDTVATAICDEIDRICDIKKTE